MTTCGVGVGSRLKLPVVVLVVVVVALVSEAFRSRRLIITTGDLLAVPLFGESIVV